MRTPQLSSSSSFVFLLSLLIFHIQTSLATDWITYTDSDGETLYLDNNRQPALYTQDYGDCQGDSAVTLTRFDAAYYKDNMTITFHLGGHTAIANESVIIYIGVYAYGENRFNVTFNPCTTNALSMCPINSSVPIQASGIIPISPMDVSGIPEIALTIPDFEGQAILRIFGNSTESQIACYSAVLTNGNSFSHPAAVGSIVGVFVAVAFVCSLAAAIYGQGLQETRKHYAHSLSIFVVFSILQHIFYTGALSMNFPSVLVAFWSNFGWASGMIHSESMQKSINQFVGSNRGNISTLGSAVSGQTAVSLGGGYSLSSIYKRNIDSIHKRELANATSGFHWYGSIVESGLPLPGNYSSFAGTLGMLDIPASNAFLTGLLWFLIVLAIMIGVVIVLKLSLEAFAKFGLAKTDRLSFFRTHWIYCAGVIVMRSCFIAFFMMVSLTLFQFTIGGGSSVLALAGIVLSLFLVGMLGISAYAVWYRLAGQEFSRESSKLLLKSKPVRHIPWYGWTRETTAREREDQRRTVTTWPWLHLHLKDPLDRPHVHDDDDYIIKFGWLSARFRRSKWWFFAAWLIYEFGRACFYGAAARSPMTQVFGLLVWEILALFTIILMRPFESNRLNMLMVYFLGFSKVVSVALCSAFDPRFGLGRILTTVIGVIIIVIQGILVICMMAAVVIGAISTWMSLRRYREDFHPANLANARTRYFAHIDQKATDKPFPKPVPAQQSPVSDELKEPYFSVSAVRRENKIEDEDPENEKHVYNEEEDDVRKSMDVSKYEDTRPPSGSTSLKSRTSTANLPYGARRHRASWSTRDFSANGYEPEHIPSGMNSRMSIESMRDTNNKDRTSVTGLHRQRSSSMRQGWTNDPSLVDVANAAIGHPPNTYKVRHSKSKSLSQSQLQGRWPEEEDQLDDRPATRSN